MRPVAVLAGVALAALLAAPGASAKKTDSSKPFIDELEVLRRGNSLSVSFRLANGLSEEALERIGSGIPVSFRHRVEVLSRRAVPLWPSKTLARVRVDTSVVYDSLTRRYELLRVVEQKVRKQKAAPPVEQRHSTDSLAEATAWMTELDEIPEIELPETADRLRVKVDSVLGRRYALYLFPARVIVSAERKLGP